jgi:hypothetical protein
MITLDDFVYDPFSPAFQDEMYDTYRTLRDDFPAYYNHRRNFWALSRFDDVWQALHDPQAFSSEVDVGLGFLPMMIFTDSPTHDRLRALVSRAFTPRRIADLEPLVENVAARLLASMVQRGGGDIIRDLAAPLPSTVIGELIGVPVDQQPEFREWAEDLVAADPNAGAVPASALSIYECFATLFEQRRREPRDDLMSALLVAEIEGSRLTQDELLGFCFLLLVAGNDNTTNLIGNGAALLARHPDQRRLLAAEPHLLPGAIEEMLRYDSPAQALPRRATTDIDIHDQTIPAGAPVTLVWGAANHDDREFEHPERFDIHRRIDRHVAFGHGLHFCLGASLARLEARAAFRLLLDRAPDYELVDDASPRVTSGWARGFSQLPVSFTTAK